MNRAEGVDGLPGDGTASSTGLLTGLDARLTVRASANVLYGVWREFYLRDPRDQIHYLACVVVMSRDHGQIWARLPMRRCLLSALLHPTVEWPPAFAVALSIENDRPLLLFENDPAIDGTGNRWEARLSRAGCWRVARG